MGLLEKIKTKLGISRDEKQFTITSFSENMSLSLSDLETIEKNDLDLNFAVEDLSTSILKPFTFEGEIKKSKESEWESIQEMLSYEFALQVLKKTLLYGICLVKKIRVGNQIVGLTILPPSVKYDLEITGREIKIYQTNKGVKQKVEDIFPFTIHGLSPIYDMTSTHLKPKGILHYYTTELQYTVKYEDNTQKQFTFPSLYVRHLLLKQNLMNIINNMIPTSVWSFKNVPKSLLDEEMKRISKTHISRYMTTGEVDIKSEVIDPRNNLTGISNLSLNEMSRLTFSPLFTMFTLKLQGNQLNLVADKYRTIINSYRTIFVNQLQKLLNEITTSRGFKSVIKIVVSDDEKRPIQFQDFVNLFKEGLIDTKTFYQILTKEFGIDIEITPDFINKIDSEMQTRRQLKLKKLQTFTKPNIPPPDQTNTQLNKESDNSSTNQ